MTADKLAQVLTEHTICWDGAFGQWGCTCGDAAYESHEYCYAEDEHAAHQAAVVLAHLTAEGWAQGREEWGYRLAEVHSSICRSTSRERAEEVARLNPTLDPHIFVRRVTDWEPVEGERQ